MKRTGLIAISLIIVLIGGLWSCDNELDITDDWKEVTVLYGLLNPADSVHYVKITKAFLGNKDAYIMAQNPDSSYYGDEIEVVLEEYSPEPNNWFIRSWNFDTTWIHVKDSGDFYYPDQKLYKVKADLDQNNVYRVKITNTKTGNIAYASTELVKPFAMYRPRSGQPYFSFIFKEVSVEFSSAENGRVHQLVITFNYKEYNITTGDTAYKKIDWEFPNIKANSLQGSEDMLYTFNGLAFYSNINAALDPDANLIRIPGDVDFTVFVGGDELSTFIDISAPINTIITERPEYSNVVNGIGIFSSRYSFTRSCGLTVQSVDSLLNGSKTWDLGFIKP